MVFAMLRYFAVLCAASLAGSSIAARAQITPGTPMPPVVTVHVDASGDAGKVPPRIFGTFIEPIDYSIDNGVVAEILVNGSLEAGLWNNAMMEEIYADQPHP